MLDPNRPTSLQLVAFYAQCLSLANLYVPSNLVRLDERTLYVVILAGQNIQIEIDNRGRSKILWLSLISLR